MDEATGGVVSIWLEKPNLSKTEQDNGAVASVACIV